MACDTNDKSIDLPSSIMLSTPTEPFVEAKSVTDEECPTVDDTCDDEQEVVETPEHKEIVVPKVSLTMPSSDVVEISQSFYWPLYTRPIDWIYQRHLSGKELAMEEMVRRVAEELQSLDFRQAATVSAAESSSGDDAAEGVPSTCPSDDTVLLVMEELMEEKEDWFNDLSGGQKSKVELVRKVRQMARCVRTETSMG